MVLSLAGDVLTLLRASLLVHGKAIKVNDDIYENATEFVGGENGEEAGR